jgi:hypothetical protein
MKQTVCEWINLNEDVIFKEKLYECELPRKGDKVIYCRKYYTVTSILRNFDEKKIEITIEQI